ncbi:TerB family tellurite resistance protein [Tenacibaculum maritimum]|uniref:tellurite resistance TerB family protein n=1 Tax=Tenacibaculum maritimum TaxID=107401 RepID=UPI0012E44908|nr:TerB family tellurite resistance protein [Tenacibaculum maritimum]MCD9564203.1 TerB family tellurite resistance protein [Tenacibaculum maritimum]MCD9565555.1 TerB family tellurite resistance protein [Tenacibaculum maritimum]MCD9579178.1 TerB family tellurite resistance protein [Tenacibaculum maritimum]MCD9596098.1 TerB family tellurite resistance protein [Tenacibaculum maritimum]MCD9613347.1 TerB family tellurite resistance protein [Tenacibaculum maritimum]
MKIIDLFESNKHRNNVAHFSAIINLASVDGTANEEEQKLISRFMKKLDITDEEYDEIIKKPEKYPIVPQAIADNRLERLLDLFKIIFSDHEIDDQEKKLILRYAIQLGYSEETARVIITKSIHLFSGSIDFDEYKTILTIL